MVRNANTPAEQIASFCFLAGYRTDEIIHDVSLHRLSVLPSWENVRIADIEQALHVLQTYYLLNLKFYSISPSPVAEKPR